jgi:probable biosynthetic protein (TIGR04099 family)
MISKLKLGMPHLTYNGLDQIWLLKQLGHNHWSMLSSGPALSKDNERLYASFFCLNLNFNQGQHLYQENDTVTVDSKLFKYNAQIYRSVHTVSNERNVTTATLDSVFVKKNMSTNELVRDDPHSHINEIEKIDQVFLDEHKKLKKQLRTEHLTDRLVRLQFNPETQFNAVKILYFANYLNLVSQTEHEFFPEIKNPIKDITVYYFANIGVDDTVYGNTELINGVYSTKLIANNRVIALCNIKR